LRPEFAEARKKYKPRNGDVKRIFVFFGGSDPHNLTGMTLRALSDLELAHMKVDAVIGENNLHRDELEKLVTLRPLTNLHIQVGNIATIMSKADLAIGSGGVNTWERVCLKLPALIVNFAENQKKIFVDLMRNECFNYLGYVDEIDKYVIKKGITDIISDQSLIKKQFIIFFNYVDGYGSQKVADWLFGDLLNTHWEVREATSEDMELYWIWANDKKVRNNALNKKTIIWENHRKWFHSKFRDSNCVLYIILIDKKPIGQVRFDYTENFARIDYSIARQFRGRRLGSKMLRLAIEKYHNSNTRKILGEVLPENIASAKIFESLGFSKKNNQGNTVYIKEPEGVS